MTFEIAVLIGFVLLGISCFKFSKEQMYAQAGTCPPLHFLPCQWRAPSTVFPALFTPHALCHATPLPCSPPYTAQRPLVLTTILSRSRIPAYMTLTALTDVPSLVMAV